MSLTAEYSPAAGAVYGNAGMTGQDMVIAQKVSLRNGFAGAG